MNFSESVSADPLSDMSPVTPPQEQSGVCKLQGSSPLFASHLMKIEGQDSLG